MFVKWIGPINIISTDSLKEFQYFQNKKFIGARGKGSEKEYLQKYALGNNQNKVRKNRNSLYRTVGGESF